MNENDFPEDVILYHNSTLYRWKSPYGVCLFCNSGIDNEHYSYQIDIAGCEQMIIEQLTAEQKQQLLLGSVEDWGKIMNEYAGTEKQE